MYIILIVSFIKKLISSNAMVLMIIRTAKSSRASYSGFQTCSVISLISSSLARSWRCIRIVTST